MPRIIDPALTGLPNFMQLLIACKILAATVTDQELPKHNRTSLSGTPSVLMDVLPAKPCTRRSSCRLVLRILKAWKLWMALLTPPGFWASVERSQW